MALVTIDQFNEYSSNYEDALVKDIFIESAETMVKEYLGYDPTRQTYHQNISGIGSSRLYLNAQPIVSITSLKIDGVEQSVEDYEVSDFYIYRVDGTESFTSGIDNVEVEYIAGYSVIPSSIKLTILRIASLLLQESNGNIGLTGKSFADNSRTFINYADYKKYLKPLDSLKVLKV